MAKTLLISMQDELVQAMAVRVSSCRGPKSTDSESAQILQCSQNVELVSCRIAFSARSHLLDTLMLANAERAKSALI